MQHRVQTGFARWRDVDLVTRLRRGAGESGQTVIMFAISLVAMLGFMAIVVDVAVIFEERRQLQNAADGAALAAARELPGSPSDALVAARSYLLENGYDTTDPDVAVAIDTSYLGDVEDVEVVVTQQNLQYLFGRVLGLGSTDVSARAVAEIVSAYEDDYAIFAMDNSCGSPGVNIQGSLATFNGTVHSNANVSVGGTDHTFDPSVTYACDFAEGGSGHTYQREQKSTGGRDVPPAVDGISFASFAPCDFSFPNPTNLKSRNDVWQDGPKTILIDGTYCFDKSVTLIGDDITGNVTFAALGSIDISGSDHNLTAYHSSGILFYSEASAPGDAIDLSGSGGAWSGLVYAPNGDVKINGQSNLNFSGSVVAQNVAIAGNGMTINSSNLVNNGNPVVRIIE